ncbi:MAG TPA: helix-turn-helix transcriptional regulator [Cyanobacteria bacterium UBA11369]|nr:helix-turn-helix transcriptional regulator [Cyanobacteria bacterium UBA11371]HBE34139.1 helix-turn-helix transcriptional regulator [Cyanobacteria bacterium UBA11368]HBE51513.1 helix-turn-helix transcriptional regulator [Cyanobacteria bacterium UBA11369]
MFATYSNEAVKFSSKQPSIQPQQLEDTSLTNLKSISILQGVLEGFIDGILILTEHGKCLHANHCAARICEQLHPGISQANSVPAEIWHVCESLIESRDLFPTQKMIIESEITKTESVAFRVRVRWLKLELFKRPCLLVTLEDRYQSIQRMVTTDIHKYGLTPREAEVWLLYRANYSYKEIADELFITLNTVKKHMKNIHAKRKAICNFEQD